MGAGKKKKFLWRLAAAVGAGALALSAVPAPTAAAAVRPAVPALAGAAAVRPVVPALAGAAAARPAVPALAGAAAVRPGIPVSVLAAIPPAATPVTAESGPPTPPSLSSLSAVLIDGDSGRVLYGRNENDVHPMASTTKIMTCILALENSTPDDAVTVSACAASMPDVQLGIREGETYRMEDLLYSLMLESHNDSAVAIAEHVAGSRETFADMMNQKARDLGCTDTWFITPNGLDAEDETNGKIHSTTAKELARILRYCMALSPKKEEFLTITRAPSHSFSNLEGTRSFSCINHNALLTTMEGALTGKTGFTNGAGYCYVGAVKKGEKTFIAALLGCGWPPNKTWKWQDMRKLVSYGNENYDYYEILKEEVTFFDIPVKNGIETDTGLAVDYPDPMSLKILMRADEPVTIRKKTVAELTAPAEAGTFAGQVDYYVGNDLVASFPVKTTRRVREWTLDFCAKTLLNRFLFCYNPW